jgi:hypothetical protein
MSHVSYADVATAVRPTGMIARGGFHPEPDDGIDPLPDGRAVRTIVLIGNVGRAMWPVFRGQEPAGDDPLDSWTRQVLTPIADELGASFVHPSDYPYRPFQQWARRADDVFTSPIGLLIHPTHGLWHAYRGAMLFGERILDLPSVGARRSPCDSCADRPCLHTCPVGAFGDDGYDTERCAGHLRSGRRPRCLDDGCAARLACPIGRASTYGDDQMQFHMRAFARSHV